MLQQVVQVGESGGAIRGGIQHPTLSFHYDVLDIRAIDATPLLESTAVEDTVLAFLCRCDDLTERVRAIVRRLCRYRPPEARKAAMQLFMLIMLSPLRRAEILVVKEMRTMPITIDLSESPAMREIIDEIIAE